MRRIGGTLPAADLFERVTWGEDALLLVLDRDENLHAPNEFMRIRRPARGNAGLGGATGRLTGRQAGDRWR